jgi:hypothetical protein
VPFVDPDHPDEEAVTDAAMTSIVTLLEEASRLRRVERDLRRDLEGAWQELERSRSLWFRTKRRLVREADHNRVAALGLEVYRSLRDRSSRSV